MNATGMRGRTVLVTGAGHGIGAAASRALSGAGASVVLAACGCPAVRALAAESGAVAVPTDLTSAVSVRRLVEQTLGAFGRLDAAFNAEADGVALAMTYEIPPMRLAGCGRIVNLALTPAVRDLTRAAALDCAGSGIRIDAVEPGPQAADTVVCLCASVGEEQPGGSDRPVSCERRSAAGERQSDAQDHCRPLAPQRDTAVRRLL